jgi:TRAP-type mannitol/chloroaromatic compound transport system substrate-binding protein
MSWKAIDRYSKDYIELQDQARASTSTRRPMRSCARSWPPGTRSSTKKSAENPLFKKVLDSRSAPSPSAPVRWQNDYHRRLQAWPTTTTSGAGPKKG